MLINVLLRLVAAGVVDLNISHNHTTDELYLVLKSDLENLRLTLLNRLFFIDVLGE